MKPTKFLACAIAVVAIGVWVAQLLEDPGTIRVISESGAAAWLLLGRTTTDSFKVPTNVLQELRFELRRDHAIDHAPEVDTG